MPKMDKNSDEDVQLELENLVYIGPPRDNKVSYLVIAIDSLGNARLQSTKNPNAYRNYHNVNILAGGLFRHDGKRIKGKINKRQPLGSYNGPQYKLGDYRSGPTL